GRVAFRVGNLKTEAVAVIGQLRWRKHTAFRPRGCRDTVLIKAERGCYCTGGCHRPGGKGVAAQGAVTARYGCNGITSIRYHTQRGGAAISDALAGRGNRATVTGGCCYLILIQAERGRYSTGGCHRPGGKSVAAQSAVTAGYGCNGITGIRCQNQRASAAISDALAGRGNRATIAGGCGYAVLVLAERGRYCTGGRHRPGGKGVAAQSAVTAGDLINGIASIRCYGYDASRPPLDLLPGR